MDNLIDLNESPKYEKTEIKKEFNLLMESAKNNFPINDSIGPSITYKREACLLHSICFYNMKKYKDELLFLQKKHRELYEIEEKRRADFLKANPGIRIKYRYNYHKIYQYIESYIIPCLEGNKKEFLHNCRDGNILFLTKEELDNHLKSHK